MFKTFLILVLVFAGYRFYKNIRLVQKTTRKKEKTDTKKWISRMLSIRT